MWPGKGCLESVKEFVEEVCAGRQVQKVALLPELNKVVVSALSEELVLVDVRLAEIMKKYIGHSKGVTSVAVSRDGQ